MKKLKLKHYMSEKGFTVSYFYNGTLWKEYAWTSMPPYTLKDGTEVTKREFLSRLREEAEEYINSIPNPRINK